MPTSYIKSQADSFAAREGISHAAAIKRLESIWDDVKTKAADSGHTEDWPYIMGVFKKRIHATLLSRVISRLGDT